MAARKIDGEWYVDFYFRRKRIRKRCPHNTKGSATQFEIELRRELTAHGKLTGRSSQSPQPSADATPTFTEFVERWMRDYVQVKNKWSERQSKRYKLNAHLLPAFGPLRLDEITTLRVDQFIAEKRRSGLSAKTINNHLTILRRCLVKAVQWGELKEAPRIEFLTPKPPETHYLPAEAADRLLAACPVDPWRSMVLTALRVGLRRNELIGLEWSDVNLDEAVLKVRRGDIEGHVDTPKSNRYRLLPLTSEVVAALRNLPRCHARVFTHNGKPVNYHTAWWQLKMICKRANIPHTSWHPLRHSFASHLTERGVPLRPVQDLLGHVSIRTTERYSHLAPRVLREAIRVLEPESPNVWAAVGQRTLFEPSSNEKTPGFTGVSAGSS